MKKIFILCFFMFFVSHIFAYENFKMIGFENAFQTEYISIENETDVLCFAPSFGFYVSESFFNENNFSGFGYSNILSVYLVSNELYLGDRALLGYATRLFLDSIPVVFIPGIIIQPEFQKTTNKAESSLLLLGMGFDLQLGTNKNGNGFGSAISIGLYPIILANTKINGVTSSINIEKYGRVSIGLSFGLCSAYF